MIITPSGRKLGRGASLFFSCKLLGGCFSLGECFCDIAAK